MPGKRHTVKRHVLLALFNTSGVEGWDLQPLGQGSGKDPLTVASGS